MVTVADGAVDSLSHVLSAMSGVQSAWISTSDGSLTLSGPFSFRSGTGRLEGTSGGYGGTVYVRGDVTYVSAGLFWQEMKQAPGGRTSGLRFPRPYKPWVSKPYPAFQGGPLGDLLFGSPLRATPSDLVEALHRQALSVSAMGPERVGGTETHEYRLVLSLDGLAQAMREFRGTINVLGTKHPVFIWVDKQHRLVKLVTSMWENYPDGNVIISVAYSHFNYHIAVTLPPLRSVETIREYQDQILKASGCPPKGGVCVKRVGLG